MCCAPQGKQDGMACQVSGLDGVVTGGGLCVHQHAFWEHGFWSIMHISRPFHTKVIGKFLLLQDLGLGERGSRLHGQLSHSHPALQRACHPSPVRVFRYTIAIVSFCAFELQFLRLLFWRVPANELMGLLCFVLGGSRYISRPSNSTWLHRIQVIENVLFNADMFVRAKASRIR